MASPTDVCYVPDRTPGPLGINDQGDPNVTALIRDTPGPTGLCDGADPSLQVCSVDDNDFVCKADTGRLLSCGLDTHAAQTPTTNAATLTITLADAQEIALKITTYFEGGKSMNYKALAGNFDGQGTSFGLIQWNFGAGTLGPLLKKMLDEDSAAFEACFGADADYATLKKALNDGKTDDQMKWAKDRIAKKKAAWKAAFEAIGDVETFQKIQREAASGEYHPLVEKVITKIRDITTTLMTQVELRSYAAMFDLCVQQGGIDNAVKQIKSRVKDEKPTTQLELMKIVVTERAQKAKNEWVSDCISRRIGILTGTKYKSTEHDVAAERDNPQFSLLTDSAEKTVASL